MDLFQAVFTGVYNLFNIEFTVYGVTLCFWEVFLFTAVAGILFWFLSEVFLGVT